MFASQIQTIHTKACMTWYSDAKLQTTELDSIETDYENHVCFCYYIKTKQVGGNYLFFESSGCHGRSRSMIVYGNKQFFFLGPHNPMDLASFFQEDKSWHGLHLVLLSHRLRKDYGLVNCRRETSADILQLLLHWNKMTHKTRELKVYLKLIHVHLEKYHMWHLLCHICQNWSNKTARPAPRSSKIYHCLYMKIAKNDKPNEDDNKPHFYL